MQQQAIIDNGTTSEGAKVAEIQALASRVQALTGSIDRWNNGMIWALVLAALAAVAVLAATRVIVFKTRQLTEAQGQLSDAKERQLAVELRDKDVKIAQAGKDASEANRGAAEATERATKAQESLALAEQHAAEADAKAEGFRLAIARANESATKAQAQVAGATAEAAKANLELARLKAPRTLTDEQAISIATSLLPFAGQEFDITPYRDIKESLALANRILNVLSAAGWKYKPLPNGSFLMGGIEGVKVFRHPESDQGIKRAVDLLVSGPNQSGIAAELQLENPTNNPKHNKININVGSKP